MTYPSPYCVTCGTNPDGTVDVSHPMKCVKTGERTQSMGRSYVKNCDVYECQKCGARVALM